MKTPEAPKHEIQNSLPFHLPKFPLQPNKGEEKKKRYTQRNKHQPKDLHHKTKIQEKNLTKKKNKNPRSENLARGLSRRQCSDLERVRKSEKSEIGWELRKMKDKEVDRRRSEVETEVGKWSTLSESRCSGRQKGGLRGSCSGGRWWWWWWWVWGPRGSEAMWNTAFSPCPSPSFSLSTCLFSLFFFFSWFFLGAVFLSLEMLFGDKERERQG